MGAYSFWKDPSYEFNLNNKTSFTVGSSHVFSTSLINEIKFNIGTEIKGGLSSGLKLGPEVEYKHGLTKKYEIDLEAEHVKDTKADASNFYNATQFRATAGELPPDALNAIDAAVTTNAQKIAYFALLLQLGASSMTMATAIKGAQNDQDHFWAGNPKQYWSSWSTMIVDGLSLVSLATAFIAAFKMDGNKRKTPQNHKNFINMDHNNGIVMGVQSNLAPAQNGVGPVVPHVPDAGTWYRQNRNSIEIGFNPSTQFNAALTDHSLNQVPQDPATTNLNISSAGMAVTAAAAGDILNKVVQGKFSVQVGAVLNDRFLLNTTDTKLLRPGGAGDVFGLKMTPTNINLDLLANTELTMDAEVVKLRKGDASSLEIKNDTASLTARRINLVGSAEVNVNGAKFEVGKVTIGELTCVTLDTTALKASAVAQVDNAATTAKNLAQAAQATADSLAGELERQALNTRSMLARMAAETESQIEFLTNRIAQLAKSKTA